MTTFKAYVTNQGFKGNPILADSITNELVTNNELDAMYAAKEFSNDYPNQSVYIFVDNGSATGFLNPDGFGINAHDWSNKG